MLAVFAAVAATLAGPTAASASATARDVTRVTPVPGEEGRYRITGDDRGAAAWDACGGGTCFFSEYDGVGDLWVVPACGRHNVPREFNDRLTSAWNRTPYIVLVFKDSNQGKYQGPMPAWFKGNLAPGHNNETSSVDVLCM